MQVTPLKTPRQAHSSAQSPSPTNADEYDYGDNDSVRAEEDGYFRQGQYPTSPIGNNRSSPWGTPGPGNDWRTQLGGSVNPNIGPVPSGIDDVSRALSALEISQQYAAGNGYQQGQSVYPPRFNPPHNFNLQSPGIRKNSNAGERKLQLVTDFEDGVQESAAYVPSVRQGVQHNQRQSERDEYPHQRERSFTSSGSSPWDPKERLLGGRMSNPNLHNLYQSKNGSSGVPSVPPIPSQYLNNQGQAPRMGLANASQGNQQSHGTRGSSQGSNTQSPPTDNVITSPIDVPSLIATKGYNPAEFDTRPLCVSVVTS